MKVFADLISTEGGSVVACSCYVRYFKQDWEETSEAGNAITVLSNTELMSLA